MSGQPPDGDQDHHPQVTTEADWLGITDPQAMWEFLSQKGLGSDRKWRLFAATCCRVIWNLLDTRECEIVEAAERFADGEMTGEELGLEFEEAWYSKFDSFLDDGANADAVYVLVNVRNDPYHVATGTAILAGNFDSQPALLRDIMGNPFRLTSFDPTWRTRDVVAIARRMYDSRDFSPMPIFADALEDAGCGDSDILAHCRGEGVHVRGCWVVDLALGYH